MKSNPRSLCSLRAVSISLAILFTLTGLLAPAHASIYIDITDTSKNPFALAVVDPIARSPLSKVEARVNDFTQTLRKDLGFVGWFRVIDAKAHLEGPNREFSVKGIDFAKWAVIDTLGLIKTWYAVNGNTVTIQAHLYDVLARTELLSKKYEGSPNQIESMAHAFADEILKFLMGGPGLFHSKIAYVCKPQGFEELCLVGLDGVSKRLTSLRGIVRSPAWSPRGSSIFFTSQAKGKGSQVFRFDVANHTARPLSTLPGLVIGMAVSPFEQLLTALTKDGNAELYTLSASGQPASRLTVARDIDVSGRYSHDGKKIVFVSDRGKGTQIYTMNADGGGVRPITFQGRRNESPAYGPKGPYQDKIVFSGMDTDRLYDIFIVNDDGTNAKRIIYDAKDNESPSWSPGGELIVFSSNRTGKYQLWVARPDGSGQTQLTNDPWPAKMPAWGPNVR